MAGFQVTLYGRFWVSPEEDEANELLLSVASVWEMQIKIQLGKLKLSLPLKELVKNQQETNDLMVSPVALGHVLALDALPFMRPYWAVGQYIPT